MGSRLLNPWLPQWLICKQPMTSTLTHVRNNMISWGKPPSQKCSHMRPMPQNEGSRSWPWNVALVWLLEVSLDDTVMVPLSPPSTQHWASMVSPAGLLMMTSLKNEIQRGKQEHACRCPFLLQSIQLQYLVITSINQEIMRKLCCAWMQTGPPQ